MGRLAVLVLVTHLGFACAWASLSREFPHPARASPGEDAAQIVVIHEAREFARAFTAAIFVDGEALVVLQAGRYSRLSLRPGDYQFTLALVCRSCQGAITEDSRARTHTHYLHRDHSSWTTVSHLPESFELVAVGGNAYYLVVVASEELKRRKWNPISIVIDVLLGDLESNERELEWSMSLVNEGPGLDEYVEVNEYEPLSLGPPDLWATGRRRPPVPLR